MATVTVLCLLFPGFHMPEMAATIAPLRIANRVAGRPYYTPAFVSFDGGDVASDCGIAVACADPPRQAERGSLIAVFGGDGSENYRNDRALSWLRLQARLGLRIWGIGGGSFILARSGILDGRQATTHWQQFAAFRERFPQIELTDAVHCQSGRIATCAGGLAGADLALTFLRAAQGGRLADDVAEVLLCGAVRDAEQRQRPAAQGIPGSVRPSVRAAVRLIEDHVSDPMPVPKMAARLGLSQRQLERQFSADLGCSVVRFALRTRLQCAHDMLASSGLSVIEVATACGFASPTHFATVFTKQFGMPPSAARGAPRRNGRAT